MEEQNLTTAKKKKWLLPAIIAVIVVVAAVATAAIYNLPANRLNRQLVLAEKYMSELNYDAAILAYKAAIEIDPKNVEAYHGAVEAYSLADNKDGFETLYADALTVVEELSAEELDATIELVKDIYLTASNVYDDNEKTAEVLEKGYEVTNNDPEIKSSLVVTYENIIDDYQKGETPDYDKLLDMCDKLLDLDAGNTDISYTRKELLADYITDLLKDGNSDTAKELIDKYKEIEPDVDYEKLVEDVINELFEDEDYETVKKLADDFKETFPDMNLDDMLAEIDTLEQEAATKLALMLNVFEYMSSEDYDSMLAVDGSDEAVAVVDILVAHDKTSYIYIPDDDGSHTGTGAGIYLYDNGYYFYYGDFVNGMREGNGSTFIKLDDNGKYVFTGEWKNNDPNGAGSAYYEVEHCTEEISGELTDGLWNGHVTNILTYDADYGNGVYDMSYDAVNGEPVQLPAKKEGWYSWDTYESGPYSAVLAVYWRTGDNPFASPEHFFDDANAYMYAFDHIMSDYDSEEVSSYIFLTCSFGDTFGAIGYAKYIVNLYHTVSFESTHY